jgi:hypothetical protein
MFLHKTKKLLYSKENNQQGEPMEWEKVFAEYTSDKT